ncbi:hypothetical protein ANANG_G00269660 [Anguilla anguilla]|uniref:Uncharacterized protein n=1 Tax=Anguilla anguilla TaxID=7936 RepID=A0A9D3LQR0_ANGAN|nr:hypothetical protein ANANG_G00269660 [Anguilla anguilla]
MPGSEPRERTQLPDNLEDLEQVLKHMRVAAGCGQQLQLEHDQVLAVLRIKQQEVHLLQKVEAEKEHEGVVHLLEVRELEQQWRSQSEPLNLLTREPERLRPGVGTSDAFSASPLAVCDSPPSPKKAPSQPYNGLAAETGTGGRRGDSNTEVEGQVHRKGSPLHSSIQL